MIRYSKVADERREAGAIECWLLHGAVGMAADWRKFAKRLADAKIGTRAVDLWRFLDCQAMPLADFGPAFNADAAGESRSTAKVLLGYSMGGRLALHALLANPHPWRAAVIVSAHPGLSDPAERGNRIAADAVWATQALAGNWQEFLNLWNAQQILGSAIPRDSAASNSMTLRRREIARSFVDWSLGVQEPLWDKLAAIDCPILWVAGENDEKFLTLAKDAVSRMPQARLSIAPGAGHRVPWEAEEWLARETAAFLTRGG